MQLSKERKSDNAEGDAAQGAVVGMVSDACHRGNTGFFNPAMFIEQRADPAQVRRIGLDGTPPARLPAWAAWSATADTDEFPTRTARGMTSPRLVMDQCRVAGAR